MDRCSLARAARATRVLSGFRQLAHEGSRLDLAQVCATTDLLLVVSRAVRGRLMQDVQNGRRPTFTGVSADRLFVPDAPNCKPGPRRLNRSEAAR